MGIAFSWSKQGGHNNSKENFSKEKRKMITVPHSIDDEYKCTTYVPFLGILWCTVTFAQVDCPHQVSENYKVFMDARSHICFLLNDSVKFQLQLN